MHSGEGAVGDADRMMINFNSPHRFLRSDGEPTGNLLDTPLRTNFVRSASDTGLPGGNIPIAEGAVSRRGKVRLSSGNKAPRGETPLWQPTRMTTSYRVLSAAGLQDDFYTSNLSWGKEKVAVALKDYLLLFHPSQPRQNSLMVTLSSPTNVAAHFPTSVAISRHSDTVCFLGHSDGAAELYACHQGGTLKLAQEFTVPTSPMDDIYSQLGVPNGSTPPRMDLRWQQYDGVRTPVPGPPAGDSSSHPLHHVRQTLQELSPTVNSIICATTSASHAWTAALATSFNGVVMLDSRQKRYSNHFGHYVDASGRGSGLAPNEPLPSMDREENAYTQEVLQQLRQATTSLMRQDRLCSISWNANGSLLATGSSSGTVRIWSVSSTREPLHEFKPFPHHRNQNSVIKALSFHPTKPYELGVGDSSSAVAGTPGRRGEERGSHNEGDPTNSLLNPFQDSLNNRGGASAAIDRQSRGGVLLLDISGAAVKCVASGWTAAPTVQLLYSPDGEHLVTAHGHRTTLQSHEAPTNRTGANPNTSVLLRNANHSLLHTDPTGMTNPTLEVTLKQWPSNSLMVWRRGGAHGEPVSPFFLHLLLWRGGAGGEAELPEQYR
ncbi:hypothetical protein AGDE_14266 [Angomonas deanei]|uniref:WD domain, G-beta repeat, putative n=1 Tax=Angomonas deanei TaxID=59799 RepID=A0A7G2C6E5_9TRYP|nr:hypothetical protein AGDE_14266 [Angomonas deanei]CAD2214333.1 WD domain, G-beta repeat, putative [Angomonas deanei]|eukprot:EPY21149.1 hypothetical protein AGDE_14266 [Angomonas deanei]